MNNKEKNLFFASDKSSDSSVIKKKTIIDHFSDDSFVVRLIFFVGFFAIIFGIWKITMQIKSPFIQSSIVLEDKEPVIQYLNRLKDSDGDGVSDYEEEYVYGTSPYLVDTDSDGISDYDEIINMVSSGAECTDDSCKIGNTADIANIINDSSGTTQTFTIEDIKKALVQSGYSQSMIDQLSESDLNKIHAEVVKAANNPNYNFEDSGLAPDTSESDLEIPDISEDDFQKLQNLSPDEIRNMMIEGGADADNLNQISNEDLKRIYLEALNETQIDQ
ncbi:MAG: hypothetical protein PHZ07_01010 [Patescibacteria group bacterium]|nr:hypothetical protein [Patescibacteria group bacterium]MDD4303982.1 hypothetical protein [Patescibacteria group bacterium]MDD4695029.1 hypothetical protein [Patescibacteria group bacterium]